MNTAARASSITSVVRRVATLLSGIGLTRTASSLSFTTLLALVPLATVALVAVARFPVFTEWVAGLEQFMLKYMVPASAYTVMHEQLGVFIDNAAGLTGVSVVFVVITALMATATVEREINLIWGIRRRRALARRLIVYAIGLTAGPVLMGATISVITAMRIQSFGAGPVREFVLATGLRPLPLLVLTLLLTALYAVVPARRVPWRHALIGAFAAALALEIAKDGFAFYLRNVPTYKAVYGALAALPVFLIWIYLCWIIVLVGAAVTAALTGEQASHSPKEPAAGPDRIDALTPAPTGRDSAAMP
ncbi:MAG: YihY family inner membrane protein [Casimicrobiaceae bacterium]